VTESDRIAELERQVADLKGRCHELEAAWLAALKKADLGPSEVCGVCGEAVWGGWCGSGCVL